MKKVLLGLVVGGALMVAPSGAMAAPGGGLCKLSGTANFTTPLTTTAKAFGYSFAGDLTPCVGDAGSGLTGKVSAGQSATSPSNPFPGYTQPTPSGNGSCTNSTTSGISFVKWSDGKITIVKYDTTGALAAVALTGTVLASTTLPSATAGQPPLTVTTTRYAGGYSGGPLAFHPADPTQCNGAGVTSAGIDGVLGTGSQS